MKIPLTSLIEQALRHPEHAAHQLDKLLRFRRRHNWVRDHAQQPGLAVPPPLAYGIELTSQCNLRCPMCYAWGERGWYRRQQEAGTYQERELDWGLAQRIIRESAPHRPYFTLWGGEPLMYSHFEDFIAEAARQRCFCYICTNGIYLEEHAGAIAGARRISLIVSLDGLAREHDQVRGPGTYAQTLKGVARLKSGRFRSVHTGVELTVLPHNLHVLEGFCEEMERAGFDWILLNLCWFISPQQKGAYEAYMQEHFSIKPTAHLSYLRESFDLDRGLFIDQYERIRARRFRIPIRWTPPLQSAREIGIYLDHPERFVSHPFCSKQWVQMDINRFGQVVACKDWPDYMVGDLRRESLAEVWNSAAYRRLRTTICQHGLMPICSKCYALPLYRDRRRDRGWQAENN